MSDPQPLDPGLATAIESLERTIKANPHKDPTEAQPPAKIIQLPIWPEPVRGAPNPLLRSAFFAAIHSSKRKELGERIKPDQPKKGVTIAAQQGSTITYAGDQLNQYDADVFFEALHRARHHPLESECFFRGYDFLKAIRRQDGPREYEDLENSLTRLRNGSVEIKWKIKDHPLKFVGGLIASYIRDEKTKLFKVTFAKEIRILFAPACWTQLEWKERMALKGKPLAQWLHSFYSSHAAPFPLSTAYLHDKSGNTRHLLKNFHTDLKHALATLETVLGWKATWDGELITIYRPPSASQVSHLRRARRRNKSLPLRPKRMTLTHLSDLFPGLPKPETSD